MNTMKYPCPCCGNKTMSQPDYGSFEICPVCYWEDDSVQFEDPDYFGGANSVSLNKARENYLRIGASEDKFLSSVRPPLKEELP